MALTQYKGTIQRPGQRPETVDIAAHVIPDITRGERAAGIEWVDGRYPEGHVYRYGPNPDPGTTDLSTAIQAAIDTAEQNGGGTVIFPPDRMAFATTVNVTSRDIRLTGSSGSKLVWTGSTSSTGLALGDGTSTVIGLVVENIEVEDSTTGTGDGTTTGLVFLNACRRSTFKDFRVYGDTLKTAGDGMVIENSWQNTFINFRANNLDNCVTFGDNSNGVNSVTFINPSIETYNSAGFNIPSGSFINHIVVVGGTFQGGNDQNANGVDCRAGNSEIHFMGTYFEDNEYSIYLDHTGSTEHPVSLHQCYFFGGGASTSASVTNVTQANPGVVTATAHGFSDGDNVVFSGIGGMIELNGNNYIVANSTANTFELQGTNTSGFTAYTTGGSAIINAAHIYHDGAVTWLSVTDSHFVTRPGVWISDTARRYFGRGNTTPSVDEVASGSSPGNFVFYDRISGAGYLEHTGTRQEFLGVVEATNMTVNTAAETVASGHISFGNGTQSTVGGAGGASALPATPRGYIVVNINGTNRVIPYFDAS